VAQSAVSSVDVSGAACAQPQKASGASTHALALRSLRLLLDKDTGEADQPMRPVVGELGLAA
jgi:hypothetical protein